MRTGAPVHRSTQSPSRRAVRAGRGRRHRGPGERPRSAIRPARRHDDRSVRSRHRQGPSRGAKAADLSAPLIPLTLRAMLRTPHPHGPGLRRRALVLFSVLALLASVCAPALVQAETVYETPETNLPGETKNPPKHKNPASPESSPKAHQSGESPGDGGSGRSEEESSESGGVPSGNPSTPGGGSEAQGKDGEGSKVANQQPGGTVQDAKPLPTTT